MRKTLLGLAAAAALVIPLAGYAAPASAADGDSPLNITFDGLTPTSTVADASSGATTDFIQANPVQGTTYGNNTMYDEGRYIVGANPHDYHPAWVDWPGATNNMMIVNGFETTDQKVLEASVPGVTCTTPGSTVTYTFSAKMANVLPLDYANDGGAKITVKINGVALGSETTLSNDPSNVVEIVGAVPASNPMTVTVVNNSTVKVGNDFAIDDLKLTQNGDCAPPPCEHVVKGVWFNYTGKFTGSGTPALSDPKWHALPAQPGGEHALSLRGFDKPYNPGADKGKGDWFVWRDMGNACPA